MTDDGKVYAEDVLARLQKAPVSSVCVCVCVRVRMCVESECCDAGSMYC